MPFSTPGKKLLRDRPADDPLGELDAAARVRLELHPHVAEHAVAAGLLLVAAVDLGLAADRLLVRDARRVGHDRRAELALEPLDDDRGVGLAHRAQDLLAERRSARGGRSAPPRASAASAGPILSRSALVWGSMATDERRLGELERRQRERLLLRPTACRRSRSPASLATAPISPALSSPIGSCSLPWSSSSWPMRSSSPRVAFQTWACEWSVPDRTRR